MKISILTKAVLILFIFSGNAYSNNYTKAKVLNQKVFDITSSFSSLSGVMEMEIVNRKGSKKIRGFSVNTLNNGNDSKSLIVFDSPSSLKGTAFLTHSNSQEFDSQWLYMPSRNKVKKIANSNLTGRFMGSEMTYEDLRRFDPEDYTSKWIREEKVDNKDCDVVENLPKYSGSGYSKVVNYISKKDNFPVKIVYYNKKGSIEKIVKNSVFTKYKDKYYFPHKTSVTNYKNKNITQLKVISINIDTKLESRLFDPKKLKFL